MNYPQSVAAEDADRIDAGRTTRRRNGKQYVVGTGAGSMFVFGLPD